MFENNLYPKKCRDKVREGRILLVEEKFDGHRGLIHLGKDLERGYLTSGRTSSLTGKPSENGLCVPHLLELSQERCISADYGYTVLDGEIIIPGHPFESVQSVLGSLPGTAQEWQRKNQMAKFCAFDILFFNGDDVRDLPLGDRKNLLFLALLTVGNSFMEGVDFLTVCKREDAQSRFDSIVSAGGEGVILKERDGEYGVGWEKWKKEETYDVVVTGLQPGAGKYCDLIGAVLFGAHDHNGKLIPIGKCSGMSDGNVHWCDSEGNTVAPNSPGSRVRPRDGEQPEGTRAWFSSPGVVGKVIEVKCNGLTEHNHLRHPQFVRVRHDKNPTDCLLPNKESVIKGFKPEF